MLAEMGIGCGTRVQAVDQRCVGRRWPRPSLDIAPQQPEVSSARGGGVAGGYLVYAARPNLRRLNEQVAQVVQVLLQRRARAPVAL